MTGSVRVAYETKKLMQLITERQAVEAGSPLALKLAEVLRQAQHNARLSRRVCVQRLTRLRLGRAALWRILVEIFEDGGPRTEPPLPLHGRLTIAAGCRAWAPWTGLAPPVGPLVAQCTVQRK